MNLMERNLVIKIINQMNGINSRLDTDRELGKQQVGHKKYPKFCIKKPRYEKYKRERHGVRQNKV